MRRARGVGRRKKWVDMINVHCINVKRLSTNKKILLLTRGKLQKRGQKHCKRKGMGHFKKWFPEQDQLKDNTNCYVNVDR